MPLGAIRQHSPSLPLQELWAADLLLVQEFMFNFLKDPLREIEEPYFSLDEVKEQNATCLWHKRVLGF